MRNKAFINRVRSRIDQLSALRKTVKALELQAEEGSVEQLSLNTQAANIFDIMYELEWVIAVYDEEAKADGNLLKLHEIYIHLSSSASHQNDNMLLANKLNTILKNIE